MDEEWITEIFRMQNRESPAHGKNGKEIIKLRESPLNGFENIDILKKRFAEAENNAAAIRKLL